MVETDSDSVTESKFIGFNIEPLNPVVPGHRIFLPYSHATKDNIDCAFIIGALMEAAAIYAWEQQKDYNLIINQGPAATQSIDHLHVHYVPRELDDGLKLPWTDQTISG